MSGPCTIEAGERFGRLTVTVRRVPGETDIDCLCDCGTPRVVKYRRWGVTQSCGCLARELARARNSTHGMTDTPEFRAWTAMRSRCSNPNDPAYKNYGGRGITVCERWRDFTNFYADMGPRPDGLSLDRIDNGRGYAPDNCRWTTASVQSKNQRHSRRTHCRKGHEFTAENTYVYPAGAQSCRTCFRVWREERAAKTAARLAVAA